MIEQGTKLLEQLCVADKLFYLKPVMNTFKLMQRYRECVKLYGEPRVEWLRMNQVLICDEGDIRGPAVVKVFDLPDGTNEWFVNI